MLILLTRKRGDFAKIEVGGITYQKVVSRKLTGTTKEALDGIFVADSGKGGVDFWAGALKFTVFFTEPLDLLEAPLEEIRRILCLRIKQVRDKVQEIPLREELLFEIEGEGK